MIEFENVSKYYGDRSAVRDLNLRIGVGELVVLLGPSGSGKSTTLRMINRLVEHDAGRIRFGGREIRDFSPTGLRRRMGYAIQSVGLFPHWTVARNIGAVPQLLGWRPAQIQERVESLLNLVELAPADFAARYPHELSGGQQQRVGVARALAADPEVLLMDEPFGALDPVTRVTLQRALKRIHTLSGKTIVLVTHDIEEALLLADRIVLFQDGALVQQGTPMELLSQPANAFVAAFMGQTDVGIRRLGLARVRDRVRCEGQADGAPLALDDSLRDALSQFLERGVSVLPVAHADGSAAGVLYFSDLLRAGNEPKAAV